MTCSYCQSVTRPGSTSARSACAVLPKLAAMLAHGWQLYSDLSSTRGALRIGNEGKKWPAPTLSLSIRNCQSIKFSTRSVAAGRLASADGGALLRRLPRSTTDRRRDFWRCQRTNGWMPARVADCPYPQRSLAMPAVEYLEFELSSPRMHRCSQIRHSQLM